MTKGLKKRITRVAIGTGAFAVAIIADKLLENAISLNPEWLSLVIRIVLFIAAYSIIGGEVVIKAVKNIGGGRFLDENFLMTLATLGAFIVGDFSEAVAVMLFYQVGECFQDYAVGRARNSIKDLMQICPDEATVLRDGEEEVVDPDEVEIGEIIVIKPGEKVPLDGVVVKGSSNLDTKALTGESMPRGVAEGQEVISGCINLNGVIEVKVTKEFGEATVTKILELVENASSKKGKAEQFITKFARWYTPLVVAGSLGLAILPPLVNIFILKSSSFGWAAFSPFIYRGLTFLVISCPCALVISIPLSFFGGIGGASKKGILIKGSTYLENMTKAEYVVMDKTGTLTKGAFKATKIVACSDSMSESEVLSTLAIAEGYSSHPISVSIIEAYKEKCDGEIPKAENVEEIAGYGVKASIAGTEYFVGNAELLKKQGVTPVAAPDYGTIVYLADSEKCLGYCLLEDEIKADSKAAVESFKNNGVKDVVMLTGDRRETAERVASEIGITSVYSELLPGDKVDKVEEIFKKKSDKGMVVFVGDGINDAPVLARADIGIAMGGLGSDAAIEAADIVIMDDAPSKIGLAMRIAKKTVAIVKENIVFAIGVKILVLLFAALGIAGMWWAIFADVGVAFLAILNAMRALYIKE